MLRAMPAPVRVALGIAVAALGVAAVVSRASSLAPAEVARNDFTQDYVSARAWADGADPYAPTGSLVRRYLGADASSFEAGHEARRNPHTPFEVVLARPYSLLGYRSARLAWLATSALAIALAGWLFARGLGWGARASAVAALGALAVPVAQKDLTYGQTNGVILLALVLAWRALRRGAPWGGAWIGAAAALKVFPVLVALVLVRRREWRALAWCAAAAAALTALGVVALGADASSAYLADAAPENYRFWRAAPMNLSLTSAPFRWLTPSPWRPGAPDAAAAATILAAVAGAACLVAIARTPARTSGDAFWAALPLVVLATPLAWEFSLVLVLPLLALAAARAPEAGPAGLLVLVAAAAVAIGVPPGLPPPGVDTPPAAVLAGYALPAYGLVALVAVEWSARPSDA